MPHLLKGLEDTQKIIFSRRKSDFLLSYNIIFPCLFIYLFICLFIYVFTY